MPDEVKKAKPVVQLTGTDSNVFMLLGRCTKALKRAGMVAEANELRDKVMTCGSYDDALCLMMDYVDAE